MSELSQRWRIVDIAAYFGVKPKTVRENYVKLPGFPKPVINISRKTRWWLSDDVVRWCRR